MIIRRLFHWAVEILLGAVDIVECPSAADSIDEAPKLFFCHVKRFSVLYDGTRSPCGMGHFLPQMALDSSASPSGFWAV